ncbi:MAG: carboxymuconolactone decarboxylase family protein [Bacteroidota bacterium]
MEENRIAPLQIPLSKSQQEQMDKIFPPHIPSPNLYRMVARNEALWKDMIESRIIGRTGLFDKGRIAPDLREKIILRTCVAAKNDYEFALHIETISLQMGVSKEQIQDIRSKNPDPALWTDSEIALFRLIDMLVGKIEVPQDVYESVHTHFSEGSLIEIVHLVGLYTGVAMLVALGKPKLDNYKALGNG